MLDLVKKLNTRLNTAGITLTTAESCTGGMIGAVITEIPGASAVFDSGFITYSNAAKRKILGVPEDLLAKHGAVSCEVAKAMAQGALQKSAAHMAVSVTGIAGPTGGTKDKPVGLVYIGFGNNTVIHVNEHRFKGDRTSIREQTVTAALAHMIDFLDKQQ